MVANEALSQGEVEMVGVDGFPQLHRQLREELEARGVRVLLDDLVGVRALLLTGPDPDSATLVVDRTFQFCVGNGAKVVRLYYRVLGHVLAGDLALPFTLIVEADDPMTAGRNPAERAAHLRAHELARQIYWDCVDAAGDPATLTRRIEPLGIKDMSELVSLCRVLPGSRARLRFYMKLLGRNRTAALVSFVLGVVRRFYSDLPGVQRVLPKRGRRVSAARAWAVNAECDQAMSESEPDSKVDATA